MYFLLYHRLYELLGDLVCANAPSSCPTCRSQTDHSPLFMSKDTWHALSRGDGIWLEQCYTFMHVKAETCTLKRGYARQMMAMHHGDIDFACIRLSHILFLRSATLPCKYCSHSSPIICTLFPGYSWLWICGAQCLVALVCLTMLHVDRAQPRDARTAQAEW